MDLTGEDAKDMAAGQRRFHWDKRHKRYVQLQAGEKLRSTGKRKTESGATVRLTSRLAVVTKPIPEIQLHAAQDDVSFLSVGSHSHAVLHSDICISSSV